MRGKELLRLVWLNITQNKFKVIMTSIGIIVGAATIVMVKVARLMWQISLRI